MAYTEDLEGLVSRNILEAIEVEFDEGMIQIRYLYGTQKVIKWLQNELPNCLSDGFYQNAATPSQQVDFLFSEFLSTQFPQFELIPHIMQPEREGMWELRTPDLRFFGWFWRKKVFIISAIDTAHRCKKHDLYYGYLSQAKQERSVLNLPPPPFISGKLQDVL